MWEHKVIKILTSVGGFQEGAFQEAIQQELDGAGQDGWELVSTTYDSSYCNFYLFFKREVE